MSKLYRKHVREQEVYCGKPAEDFFTAAYERKTQELHPCERCKDILNYSLWCDKCIQKELDLMEEYYNEEEYDLEEVEF